MAGLFLGFANGTYPRYPEDEGRHLVRAVPDLWKVAARFQQGGFNAVVRSDQAVTGIRAALREHVLDRGFSADEPVVLWFSGHGLHHPVRGFTLAGVGHDPEDALPDDALPVTDFLVAFADHPTLRHLLVVLDCCFAGAGREELQRARQWLEHDLPVSGKDPKQLAVFASTRSGQRIRDGAFVDALLPAWEKIGASHRHIIDRFVPLKALAALTAEALADSAGLATVSLADETIGVEWFPNVNWLKLPQAVHAPVLDHAFREAERVALSTSDVTRLTEQALREHFEPKSRGGVRAGQDFFVGREKAIADLADWLGRDGVDSGLAVVTGQAGSGKSAVVGRTIRALPDEIGPVLVWARRRTRDEVVRIIALACGLPDTVDLPMLQAGIARRVAQHGQTLRVVIDALDEAGSSLGDRFEARRIADLVRDLRDQPGVRILVGTRKTLLDKLDGPERTVDLDSPPYTVTVSDTHQYIRSILVRNPVYRDDVAATQALSRAITERVRPAGGTNFLFARTATTARLNDSHPFTRSPGWERDLPATFAAAFTEDILERLGPRDAEVFHALAWAEGSGVSLDDWRVIAQAVTRQAVSDEQVWRVRTAAADYLMVSTAAQTVAVHLFHQALADHVRSATTENAVQRRITAALTPGRGSWGAAGDYVRSHLPTHAAAAGMLDELMDDAGFLLVTDIAAVHRATAHLRTEPGRACYDALQLTSHLWPEADPRRLWWLHVNARRRRADRLAESAAALLQDPLWTVGKAWWTGIAHRTIQLDHTGPVTASAFGVAAGKPVFATASEDGTAKLWDPLSGLNSRTMSGHTGWINAVAFGTVNDRTVLATAGHDTTVRLYDTETETNRGVLQGHYGAVNAVTFTELNGRDVVATAGDDATIRLWDAEGGRCLRVMNGHQGPVMSIAAGRWRHRTLLVTGSQDATARIWDLASGECTATLRGHHAWVNAVAIEERDGTGVIATAGWDRTIRLWDTESGGQRAVLRGHAGLVSGMTFCAVGEQWLLATASLDRTVRLWDVRSQLPIIALQGHTSWVTSVTAGTIDEHPTLASTGRDGTLRLWDPRARPTLISHTDKVTTVCLEPSASVLVTASLDHTTRVWDMASGVCLRTLTGHTGPVRSVIAASELLATAGDDYTVRLWEPLTGTCTQVMTGHTRPVIALAAGADMLASASLDGTVRLWHPHDGACLHDRRVTQAALGWPADRDRPDSRPRDRTTHKVTADLWDASIPVKDPVTGLIEAENLLAEPRHEGDLSAVALGGSLAVPTLVTAAVDGSIRVWDIRTGSVRSLDQHGQRVTAVALTSRDGRLVLASSSDDRTVRIWDLDNGSCIRSLGDESTPIATVVWDSAENGRFLATASLDGLVRLWEPWTGECIQVLRGHTLPVTGLAMRNRAGRLILATSGEDDSILVWQPPN